MNKRSDQIRKIMLQATKNQLAELDEHGIYDDRPRPYFEYDINCGKCEDWAVDVGDQLDKLGIKNEVIGNMEMPKYEHLAWHVFIKIGRKYYDCECLEGTTRIISLPIFGRNSELGREEVRKIQSMISQSLLQTGGESQCTHH